MCYTIFVFLLAIASSARRFASIVIVREDAIEGNARRPTVRKERKGGEKKKKERSYHGRLVHRKNEFARSRLERKVTSAFSCVPRLARKPRHRRLARLSFSKKRPSESESVRELAGCSADRCVRIGCRPHPVPADRNAGTIGPNASSGQPFGPIAYANTHPGLGGFSAILARSNAVKRPWRTNRRHHSLHTGET